MVSYSQTCSVVGAACLLPDDAIRTRQSLRLVFADVVLNLKAYDLEVPPEVGELDELETLVGSQKTKLGCGLPWTT